MWWLRTLPTCSGSISTAELKAIMTGLGERFTDKDVEDMIKSVDKSGRGVVSSCFQDWWRVIM